MSNIRPSSLTTPSVGSWWSLGTEEYLSSNLEAVVVTIPSRSHQGYDGDVRASLVGQVVVIKYIGNRILEYIFNV